MVKNRRGFLSDLSAETFTAHLRALGSPGPFPHALSGKGLDEAVALLNGLDEEANAQWEIDRNRVEALSTDDGVNTLALAAQDRTGLEAQFRRLRGERDCALWVLVHTPSEFARAETIQYSDSKRNKEKFWTGFVAGRSPGLRAGSIDYKALKLAIADALQVEGRIDLEIIDRPERDTRGQGAPLVQVSIWREGTPKMLEHFAPAGRTKQTITPSISAVLLFNPNTGALDVMCEKGGKNLRQRLAHAFCDAGLDREAPVALGRRSVNLSSLRVHRELLPSPSDGISRVEVVGLTLEGGVDQGLLHLDAPSDGDIWRVAESWNINLAATAVTRAIIAINFAPTEAYPQGRRRKIKLATPNGCTLSHWNDSEREIGERLLSEWGLRV